MYSVLMHKDVHIPAEFVEKVETELLPAMTTDKINYSKHLEARFSQKNDRSHNYLESTLKRALIMFRLSPVKPFEVEVSKDFKFFGQTGFFVTKFAVRAHVSDVEDLMVVVRPIYETGTTTVKNFLVVTAWLNATKDNHATLDESNYLSYQGWQEEVKKMEKAKKAHSTSDADGWDD